MIKLQKLHIKFYGKDVFWAVNEVNSIHCICESEILCHQFHISILEELNQVHIIKPFI
jgi:hypothetical protein